MPKSLHLCTMFRPFPFIVLIFLLAGLPVTLSGQATKIMGKVTDSLTGEGIPFVNLIIPGTTIGTLTDFDGNYSLEFLAKGDSIRAFLIGYAPRSHAVRLHQFQAINLSLIPREMQLPEVTIRYSGNPAEVIIRKVIAAKEKNTLRSFENYQYDAYTKIELDANNLSDDFRNRRLFDQFSFIWNYMDTSTLNGKPFLPVLITETMSEIFFRKTPRARKEIIKASRISGMENISLPQFFGNLSEQVDIYRNFVTLFEKNFVSPVSEFAIDHYKFYLVDSLFIGNQWCYHIMFKPRRKQELTFTGNLWIHDTSFAVKKVDMRVVDDANLNFINDLEIAQEFEFKDNLYWMLTVDKLIADFNIIQNTTRTVGFFGFKTTIYSNFRFNITDPERYFKTPSDVYLEPGATGHLPEYWDKERPEKLSEREAGIYQMVDSVKAVPLFKTYQDLVYGIFTGYLPWGWFEFGPYSKLFSYNGVEGYRFRLGARTANSFSKKIQLDAYLAYGTWDQKFKYGGGLIYMFSKNPRRDLTARFKYDVEQLGASPLAVSSDNLLGSLFHRGPNNKLTLVYDYRIAYEHEWFNGLINRIHFVHREQFPLGQTEFIVFPEPGGEPLFMNSIYTSEIQIDTRLSFRERFVAAEFERVTISSDYPIFQVRYIYGFPNVFKSDYEYHKLILNVSQWFNFRSIGWSKYIIEAGKIWGTLPYPLLRIHDGNQTFFFDDYASNLMDYYEFVSDQWISASYTHHFNGLLFNKIPLLRKLKWREVAHVRGVFGSLATRNQEYSLFPGNLRSFNRQPYWEAGAGIENIFKVFRVDAIWRMSHLNDAGNPDVSKFGIFASLFFSF